MSKLLDRQNLEIQLYDVGDYEAHDDLHGLAGVTHWQVEQAVVRGQEHLQANTTIFFINRLKL